MDPTSIIDAESLAIRIRRDIVSMTERSGASHVASSLSLADVLAVLYSNVLNVSAQEPALPSRDRLIVSKGHAGACVYAALAESGFFPREKLETFYADGSDLVGHVTSHGVPGVEWSTGSLGHGLSVGAGMALAAKRRRDQTRVFVVLSDGECDEGSVWEAVLFGAHHQLDNLVAIIDYNKLQSLTTVSATLGLEPLAEKWQAFGWSVVESDGHDVAELKQVLCALPIRDRMPSCVVAHTIKGKGVSFMENEVLWHYRAPDSEEARRALKELGES